jgi:hypothetical protein
VGDGEFAAMSQPASMTALPAAASDVARARGTLPALRSPAVLASAGLTYLTLLLAADHYASQAEQGVLGVVTAAVLLGALTLFPVEQRAQALGVVVFATIGEVTGSLVWGVYTYRLDNLPLFVPPAHGLVYLTGLALAAALARHTRALIAAAVVGASVWGLLGLLVLPQRDVAGAFGIPLLLAFLWLSRSRAVYAGVFLVVAALELYGTAIGTWRWAAELPGLGIPNGNPPSGVASGYVWFDVMALLVAPALVRLGQRLHRRSQPRTTAPEQPLPGSTPA